MARKGTDSLTATRAIFLSWIETQILIVLISVLALGDGSGDRSIEPSIFAAGVAAFGVLTLGMVVSVTRKPLDGSSAESLVGTYRTRFFLRMALSQAVFLMGFVGVFVTGEPWLVLAGLPFALFGFALAAPTSSKLAHDQEALRARGSQLDLVHALVSLPLGKGVSQA